MMTETSQITKSPLLPIIRKLVTTMFIYADKSLVSLSEKYKLLETIRYIIITCFLFLVRFLPSLFLCLDPNQDVNNNIKIVPTNYYYYYYYNSTNSLKGQVHAPISASGGDSGIERALSQLLSIINDIPVSSRKYDIVRSLAERLIDENHVDNIQTLRQVNRTVLSGAFSRALSQLEVVMVELGRTQLASGSLGFGPVKYILNRVFKVVQSVKEGPLLGRLVRATATHDNKVTWSGDLAEKLVAELLWLAQKMVACGDGEEAVWRWASASNVAWLALTAEPRLQCSLVKVSAFLFKQAKDMRVEDFEEGKKELNKQTKKRMLMSWLPLLCRANNGMDAPVLCTSEKAELERVLEAIIENFSHEEDQEQVLSIWLYHFTHCPSSDWPNLHNSYARWCTASRRHLILQ